MNCVSVNVNREVFDKIHFDLLLLLLLLALQPTVSFSLLSDSIPFCSFFTLFLHCLIPIIRISSSMYTIHLLLGLPPILVSIGFHSNILLGVL